MTDNLLWAPCVFCGYIGDKYWQPLSHAKDCPWYTVGGEQERQNRVRLIVQRLAAKNKKMV